MARRKTVESQALRYKLTTKVNESTFQKLNRLLEQNPRNDMSKLVRAILTNRPVRVFTRDQTLDNVMEELTRLRTEIRHIGININQITHEFNTYPEPQKKLYYAKIAFNEYLLIEPKIDRLLNIIANHAERWLQK